jgi:hypothetical protein
VVPSSMRQEVLSISHGGRMSGHLSYYKTMGKISERFFWHGYRQEVYNYCKACNVCASRKPPIPGRRAPLKKYQIGAPME